MQHLSLSSRPSLTRHRPLDSSTLVPRPGLPGFLHFWTPPFANPRTATSGSESAGDVLEARPEGVLVGVQSAVTTVDRETSYQAWFETPFTSASNTSRQTA